MSKISISKCKLCSLNLKTWAAHGEAGQKSNRASSYNDPMFMRPEIATNKKYTLKNNPPFLIEGSTKNKFLRGI